MRKRPENSCEDVCKEHSGLHTMIYVVMVGVASTLIMQSYNSFVQVSDIKTSIQSLKNDITITKIEAKNADASLDSRVSKLEGVVYKNRR